MITLVTGGCGSGKSEYAENLVAGSGCPCKWYVATMEVWGNEDRRKVERHRKQRAGKGFHTIERPRGLNALRIPGSPEQTAVLLECVSNLAANEMFGGETLPDCAPELAPPGRRWWQGSQAWPARPQSWLSSPTRWDLTGFPMR